MDWKGRGGLPHHVRIGLVGDYQATVPAHQAIPLALRLSAQAAGLTADFEWIPTEEISSAARVSRYDGLWCTPASPYLSMPGALTAIRHARENAIPFLGTCGGFQHTIVEYARHALGWQDAEHAEIAADAPRAVIAPLSCALVEATGRVSILPGSRLATAYGTTEAIEGYHCRYGLNPRFQEELVAGPLRAVAHDEQDEVRAVELDGHPFFVATLFQPERAALKGTIPPLVAAFVRACAGVQGH